ncbi:carboxylesterase [Abortiporus biennis]|nr:carboxylesterase [Abortiporus biennis]
MIAKATLACSEEQPVIHHPVLKTTFSGLVHILSTPQAIVHQYRGIKYASIPARFRQPKLWSLYSPITDATHYGPICPQPNYDTYEVQMFGLNDSDDTLLPRQIFKHDEFECLNLNITCPAPSHTRTSEKIPVMLWIHGGGNRGSGSSWLFDGGALVQKSIQIGKPIILVTINFRLGLLGFAASPALRDDNRDVGEDGVGNYGLYDQRRAMEWVHKFIGGFGGDPNNITLFGESTGAMDILCHIHSTLNETAPMFQRAIVQSAAVGDIPTVHSVGWQLSKIMSSLRVHSVDDLRAVDAEILQSANFTIRAIDDGVFLAKGWQGHLFPKAEPTEVVSSQPIHAAAAALSSCHLLGHDGLLNGIELDAFFPKRHRGSPHPFRVHSRSRSRTRHHEDTTPEPSNPTQLQPLLIGDCGAESQQWSLPASLWTAPGVVRRIRAVCQSLNKSAALLRAYDITTYTPDDELPDRILELINDARFAWPTECIAKAAKENRNGHNVWRYVFDQESPSRGVPHHGIDLLYLFDTVPLPCVSTPLTPDMCFGSDSSSEDGRASPDYGFGLETDDEWGAPIVDEYSYNRVRDAIQGRWISFAYGESPWKEDKVYLFGPEGEIGERSQSIFEGRRRVQVWKEALEPLGLHIVQKIGVELCNGPPVGSKCKFSS